MYNSKLKYSIVRERDNKQSKKNKIYIKYKIFYRSIVVIETLNKTNIKQKITSIKYILSSSLYIYTTITYLLRYLLLIFIKFWL